MSQETKELMEWAFICLAIGIGLIFCVIVFKEMLGSTFK